MSYINSIGNQSICTQVYSWYQATKKGTERLISLDNLRPGKLGTLKCELLDFFEITHIVSFYLTTLA